MLETDLFLKFSALYNFIAQILTMVIDFGGRHQAGWAQTPSWPPYTLLFMQSTNGSWYLSDSQITQFLP